MTLDTFSPTRGHLFVKLTELGAVITTPGTPEDVAARELVAFGRAYRMPGSISCYAPERRIDPARENRVTL